MAALMLAPPARGQNGTWNVDANGLWSTPSNWLSDTIADGSGSTANFTNDITADRTVSLDSDRTLTNVVFGDSVTSSAGSWILNNNSDSTNNLILAGTTPTITVNALGTGRNATISAIIEGTAGLTKAGTGTLILSGANTYTGTTVISSGILAISNNTALGATSGNTTIAATGLNTGPQLSLSGGITSAEPISITGNSEQNQYVGVITNTSETNTLSGAITLANPAGTIRLSSGGGELIFSGTISQTTSTRTLTLQATGGAALTVNNAIANNGGQLAVINSGVTTLKGASTAIGATTIAEGGYLKLGVTNAIRDNQNLTIGSPWNFTGSDQGTFDLAGFNQTVNALVGTKNTSNVGADSTRIVTNSVTGTSTLTVGNGNTAGTFNGVIQDGGAGRIVALTKTGTGTQTLIGDSNYSGVTTISGGAIAITHSNSLGSTAGNTTIAATGASTGPRLLISGTINSPENITLTGTTEVTGFEGAIINTANTNTLSGNITLNGTGGLKIRAQGGTLNLTGNITQSTGKTRSLVLSSNAATAVINVSNPIAINGGELLLVGQNGGDGALVTLNGASGSGIGGTTLAQRVTLRLGVSDALNTAANLTVSYGGTNTGEDRATLDLRGFNQTVNALTGNAGSSNASANSNRVVTNGAAGTGTSIFTVGNGNGSGTFNGQINNGATASIQLIKTGTGNQTLNDQNSYTGGTRIDGGTLTLGHATNTLANTGAINVNGGTLALGANSDTVGAVTLTSGSITGTTGVLNGASYAVQSGSVSAILGGSAVALTKSTSGTVTLSGVNTYTGATSVNAGTLFVNGTLAAGSAVSVGASGTLGGTGAINGAATIFGAHTPGNSPGIQTFGSNLTYSGGSSTVEWELVRNTITNAANPNAVYDQILVAGNLDFAGATSLSLLFNGAGSNVLWANPFWDTDQQWTLYDVAGSTTNFGNLSLAAGSYLDSASNPLASARPNASFNVVESGSDVVVSYVAVPEPTTIGILGTGLALLGLRIARRRKA